MPVYGSYEVKGWSRSGWMGRAKFFWQIRTPKFTQLDSRWKWPMREITGLPKTCGAGLATAPRFACFELHPQVALASRQLLSRNGVQKCHKSGGQKQLSINQNSFVLTLGPRDYIHSTVSVPVTVHSFKPSFQLAVEMSHFTYLQLEDCSKLVKYAWIQHGYWQPFNLTWLETSQQKIEVGFGIVTKLAC